MPQKQNTQLQELSQLGAEATKNDAATVSVSYKPEPGAEAPKNDADTVSTSYKPEPGAENHVHLSLVHGRRFNPSTGKEESEVYTQLFTFAEWQLFKENHARLGYTIVAVLHDPYGEADKFVAETK